MTYTAVLVDDIWYHVEEIPHPDNPAYGDVVAARRVSDGCLLKVRHDTGDVEFEAGTPGVDERLIPVPGAYVANRDDLTIVIEKAGPWTVS